MCVHTLSNSKLLNRLETPMQEWQQERRKHFWELATDESCWTLVFVAIFSETKARQSQDLWKDAKVPAEHQVSKMASTKAHHVLCLLPFARARKSCLFSCVLKGVLRSIPTNFSWSAVLCERTSSSNAQSKYRNKTVFTLCFSHFLITYSWLHRTRECASCQGCRVGFQHSIIVLTSAHISHTMFYSLEVHYLSPTYLSVYSFASLMLKLTVQL